MTHEREEHPIEYDLSHKNYLLEQKKGWPTLIGNLMKIVIFCLYYGLVIYLIEIVSPWFVFLFIPVAILVITFWINNILDSKISNNNEIIRTKERKELEKRNREYKRRILDDVDEN